MNYCSSIFGICLFCCSFSAAFSENDFREIEKEMRLAPPGYGQPSDELTIYSRSSQKIIQNITDEQRDRVKNKVLSDEINITRPETEPYLKINKEGIKVYVYHHKNSPYGTFKAETHVRASLDSIVSLLLDNTACVNWIHACSEAFIIKEVSFNERYHYQIMDIPFPFHNRGFLFHSIMSQNPDTRVINIISQVVADYCQDKKQQNCDRLNHTDVVKINKSIGSLKLVPEKNGTTITWIQHTDPSGHLPAWLVNHFVAATPYRTFKNLSQMVQEEKYKYSKLIYNSEGVAYKLDRPEAKNVTRTRGFDLYPTF